MNIKDTFKTAIGGLATHKSRSALTILGIVIGITSIILVMSIGESAQSLILGQIQSLGPTNVFIHPGRHPQNFAGFAGTLLVDSIKIRDIEELQKKSNVPDVVAVSPYVFTSDTASYGSETYSSIILGVAPNFFDVSILRVARGIAFGDADVASHLRVAVIGTKVAKELFGASDPIGQDIKIKNNSFRVIGVLAAKGQMASINFDEIVLAPYSAIQQYILGIKHFHEVIVEVGSIDAIPGAVKDIEQTLRQDHNITDPNKDDFYVQTQKDAMNTVGAIATILTTLLSSVAAISLLVGGIGIMNIMLVSVTERTREIGLRKALGATDSDILRQFLYEAVMLTLSGGVVGIIMGTTFEFLAAFIITRLGGINFPFTFSVQGAILGVVVAAIIGLGFGIFPARQAAKKNPIEALRYE